jgi:flavin-dependent dehydrogenase
LRREGGEFVAHVSCPGETQTLRAKTVIAAHGSWERGPLTPRIAPRASDLLGFKARFSGARLPEGLMPLVLFPGGYGGLVRTDGDEVSFSCCIRRDALAACRRRHPGLAAGEAVIAHVTGTCRGVRESLAAASLEEAWLSSGPIRPGIRGRARDGIFSVGNAAGEAHPLVAEGISMAVQSAWLLCESLLRSRDRAASDYPAQWRRHFATRVRASSVFAALTTSPRTAAASAAFMKHVPAMLTWGARWSGKAHSLPMGMT